MSPEPASQDARAEGGARRARMLRTALGANIVALLDDPDVVEVMLNPDGHLWVDRHGSGRNDTGNQIPAPDAERIIRLVAGQIGDEAHADRPLLAADLPLAGERFQGVLPPVAVAPAFTIRKRARTILTLDDYVARKVMTDLQAAALRRAVRDRLNILVVGGTGSGKTTLVNAILAEIATTGDRVVLIEDTPELQCAAPDLCSLRTRDGTASMRDLVRATLRLRPDRIVVGEVRGPEALDLLKAWGTGHPGGVATLHANSALAALPRLEQLVQEAVVSIPRTLVADTVGAVVFIDGHGNNRRVRSTLRVEGLLGSKYQLLELKP